MYKVLFLIESLSGGGAEKVLSTLLKHIEKKKFDITLCCIVNTGMYVEDIKPYVHYKYILTDPSGLKGISAFFYMVKYKLIYNFLPLSLVYRWFIPKRSDVEVAFVEGYATKLLSHSTNKRSRKIAWVHIDLHEFHWTKFLYSNIEEESDVYNKYDQIVTVANSAKDAFRKIFPTVSTPIKTIYNPIENGVILRQSQEEVFVADTKRIRLVSVGRLTKQKAFGRLISIVSRLKKDGFSLELWLLGDGHERTKLEKLVKDNDLNNDVKFWGFQSNPYAYMRQCDMFVCSSVSEGYSTAVTEALILGLPVVTTDCSGMTELLKNGEYGIITDNSEDALYIGIRCLLDDPNALAYYKQKALERGKDFSISNLMKPIEDLLTSC